MTAGPARHQLARLDFTIELKYGRTGASWLMGSLDVKGPHQKALPSIPRSTMIPPNFPADMGEWNPSPTSCHLDLCIAPQFPFLTF